MRVIAGSAKRLLLKTVNTDDVRPTTDRIKETLFNILNPYLIGSNFLDLFAGSGGIGIEALSRGAAKAVFIEKNRLAVKYIHENLSHTGFDKKGTVLSGDVLSVLKSHRLHDSFDFIFLDPPYGEELYLPVLRLLKERDLLAEDALVILECNSRDIEKYSSVEGYSLERIKDYKNTAHIFLKGD